MILVDGRVDEEKLRELLEWGSECTELDFKEIIDLSAKINELEFVKDAVSMLNHYPGGYLVVGATDDGRPSDRVEQTEWRHLDGDILTKKVRKYVDGTPVITSKTHMIGGHKYCLICMKSPEDGMPMPFNKNGQSGNELVFREGEIIRRDGAGNGRIKYSQWGEILEQHDRIVRASERERVDDLIERVSEAIADAGRTPPLEIGMSEEALRPAIEACFEKEEIGKLTRYADKLGSALIRGEDAFAELASLGAYSALNKNEAVFMAAVDALYDYYERISSSGPGSYEGKLKISVALYELGAAAVRSRCWSFISPMVNRQSPGPYFPYASWLRECQVDASRAGLFKEQQYGMMISCALEDMKEHKSLCPDYDFESIGESGCALTWEEASEEVLDSLCSFDFLYCVCVYAEGDGQGEAYPACVAFNERRVSRIIAKLYGKSESMRRELLTKSDDRLLAQATSSLWEVIYHQASQSGQWSWHFETTGMINAFLEKNLDLQKPR